MSRYELNADVGEGFPYDDELLRLVTQANVACGFHAGDEATMRDACLLAAARGVSVGAQVSYRDRDHFGRRDLEIEPQTLVRDLSEQVSTLTTIATGAQTLVSYLKPHGALYNRVVWDERQAAAVVEVCRARTLPVMCLPGSALLELAAAAGVATMREFFADRAYDARGRLVPRADPGAVIDDPEAVSARVRRLVRDGTVETVDGSVLGVEADSVCVHGDTPEAAAIARAVREALDESSRAP